MQIDFVINWSHESSNYLFNKKRYDSVYLNDEELLYYDDIYNDYFTYVPPFKYQLSSFFTVFLFYFSRTIQFICKHHFRQM